MSKTLQSGSNCQTDQFVCCSCNQPFPTFTRILLQNSEYCRNCATNLKNALKAQTSSIPQAAPVAAQPPVQQAQPGYQQPQAVQQAPVAQPAYQQPPVQQAPVAQAPAVQPVYQAPTPTFQQPAQAQPNPMGNYPGAPGFAAAPQPAFQAPTPAFQPTFQQGLQGEPVAWVKLEGYEEDRALAIPVVPETFVGQLILKIADLIKVPVLSINYLVYRGAVRTVPIVASLIHRSLFIIGLNFRISIYLKRS